MRLAVLAGMLAAVAATSATSEASERVPTSGEQKAFEAWYRARPAAASAPALQVQVHGKGKRRTLGAHEDAPSVRAVLPLCRTQRTVFERGPKAWSERTETWAWIHHTPQCGAAPAAAFQLRTELPEIDVLRLVQAQAALLNSARLLMAGNTSCSPTRSRNFRLIALDKAKDGLPMLVFISDIGTIARISVRTSRADLSAWNVSCEKPA